jgi:riboflavin synthase
MFTGLIEAVGEALELKPTAVGARLRVGSRLGGEVRAGDSVAVNGVCLTAIAATPSEIHFDLGPETMRVTTLGALGPGVLVNLERPLRADGRLGGHFVQGHVDDMGVVEEIRAEGEFCWLTVSFSGLLRPYLVRRGSIALDGISLTIAGLGHNQFDVQIVPFTWEHTNLRARKRTDRVNLECDILGKYAVGAAELLGLEHRPGSKRAH